jgi:hypothetical protein
MKSYDSPQDMEMQKIKERAEFEVEEEVFENTDDPEDARRLYRKRHEGTGSFTAAQRGYNRHIDADRVRKAEQRAEEKRNKQ